MPRQYEWIKKKAIQIIKEKEENDNFIWTEVRDELKEMFWKAPTAQTIRNRHKQLYSKTEEFAEYNKEAIDDLNELKKKKAYVVEEKNWKKVITMQKRVTTEDWIRKTREYYVPIELAAQLTFDYSRDWRWLSWPQITNKYDIEPSVWKLLKSRLNIYKDSHAVPDVVLDIIKEEYWEDALEEKIEETSYRAIQAKYWEKYKESREEALRKQAQDAIETMSKVDNFLEHVRDYLVEYKPEKLPEREEVPQNNDSVDVAISDLHIWRWDDALKERLGKIRDGVLQLKEDNVNIIFLWDMFETLASWWMHKWQLEDMWQVYWFDLLMKGVDLMCEFLTELHKWWKRVSFYWIWWNHDRVVSNASDTHEYLWSLVAFELIKTRLSDLKDTTIEYFRDKITSFETDNFGYAISHKLYKKQQNNFEKILWNAGLNSNKHNLVMHGHEHSVNMAEGKNATLIGLPALTWGNQYAKDNDYHSTPGFIVIKERDWLADIFLKRLK